MIENDGQRSAGAKVVFDGFSIFITLSELKNTFEIVLQNLNSAEKLQSYRPLNIYFEENQEELENMHTKAILAYRFITNI